MLFWQIQPLLQDDELLRFCNDPYDFSQKFIVKPSLYYYINKTRFLSCVDLTLIQLTI